MKKQLLSMVLAMALVCGLSGGALAADVTPKVNIDGVEFVYDTATYGVTTAVDGRIFVPLRVIAEQLGYEVGFVDGKATVDGPRGLVIIDLGNLDSKSFAVGTETETLDTPVAMVVNNRTLIGLRGFGNALGCEVEWREGAAWINKNAPSEAGSVENKIGSAGNTSVDTVLTEYDPAALKHTNDVGPGLAESFGIKVSGLPASSYEVDNLGNNKLLVNLSDQRGLQLKMHVESSGTIVIFDSDFSNTKQGKAFMSMVDAFLSDTANPRIKAPVMEMFNKLVKKLSVGVNDTGNYSVEMMKWCDENLHQKAYNLTDDYAIMFTGQGSSYAINIFEKKNAASDLDITSKFVL